MDNSSTDRTALARRHFFRECRVGLGALALGELLRQDGVVHAENVAGPRGVPADREVTGNQPHVTPRAKSIIFLFMAGGPSQLELFDYKPQLQKVQGQRPPDEFLQGKRFSFIKPDASLLGTNRKFKQFGQSGQHVSECLPHISSIVDDIAIVKSMKTDVFNHGPAKFLASTGYSRPGFPSMGSWISYGIGSESRNLPAFVVLPSGPRGPRGGSAIWDSGFLPTVHQGVAFRGQGDPVNHLANPPGVDRQS